MLLIFMCFSWLRTLLLLSSMKMYDNPFIVLKTIGYRDHWRNGISSERQIDQTKRLDGNPSCATNSPMDRSGRTPEGGKLQHRTVAGAKSNR
jgi:hypothetical protein